jgi:hypothetical protein
MTGDAQMTAGQSGGLRDKVLKGAHAAIARCVLARVTAT